MLKRSQFSELSISRFTTPPRNNTPKNNSLIWLRCNKVGDHKTSNALWKKGEGFLFRIWLFFFFIPKSSRKYSHTNSCIFAMTVVTQDDHLTAGAYVAWGYSTHSLPHAAWRDQTTAAKEVTSRPKLLAFGHERFFLCGKVWGQLHELAPNKTVERPDD